MLGIMAMPQYDLGFHYVSSIDKARNSPNLPGATGSGEAGDPGVSLTRALGPLFQSQLAHGQEGQHNTDTSITYTHGFLIESH